MQPSEIMAGIAVLTLLLTVGSYYFTWHSNRNRAQRAEIDELKSRLAEEQTQRRQAVGAVRDRITTVEANMAHLPSQQQIGNVYETINEVAREVSALGATLNGVGAQVARIDDYLRRDKP